MRILHVAECWTGGVGRAIETIATLLPEHEHHLLWTTDEPWADPPDPDLFDVITRLPKVRRVKAVSSALAASTPDVVHAHSSWAGVYARLRSLPVPVIYQPHCYKFDDPMIPAWQSNAFRQVERYLTRNTQVTAVLTDHERDLTLQLSPGQQVFEVPNAPTVPVLEAAGDRNLRAPVVAMIGRIGHQKSPEFFADVARLVWQRRPEVEFCWIGDGPQEERAQVESAGIQVTGWLSREQVVEKLRTSHVYLHSATYEGFPLSVLDAAACGVGIIVRDIPPFNGTSLYAVADAEAAAAAVLQSFDDASFDDDLMARSAQLLMVRNDDNQRKALLGLYEAALATSGNPAHLPQGDQR